ncbi:hypothetical protein C8J57DRAFT_1502086 [Mycena rebaudengoi]|nr:hypothetical protein C8J57DRAFT_1502085 [Mycena rebaudengoi]KAJ7279429.1 hypothetical protein C8J57DRAFT_1502086 [Mycena rebaudengoi]
MFSKSLILFASIAASSALAVGPTTDVGSTITVCSSVDLKNGCLNIPINADTCKSFTGGLAFLNNEVSSARVPDGFACTFFDSASCISNVDTDVVFLQGGPSDFRRVQGIFGIVNFNDKASSFQCSTF